MKTFRQVLAGALVVAMVIACGGPAGSPNSSATASQSADARLEVSLTSGPSCPVEQNPPDPNCAARPVANEIVTVSSGGIEVARGRSDAQGRITFGLPPGEYTVTGLNETGFMGPPEPATVLIGQAAVVTVDLVYDTGIR
jgi:hypothetical protein